MLSLRRKGGRFEIAFVKEELEILMDLPGQLREIIENPDFTRQAARRLFPPGSEDGSGKAREFAGCLRLRSASNPRPSHETMRAHSPWKEDCYAEDRFGGLLPR